MDRAIVSRVLPFTVFIAFIALDGSLVSAANIAQMDPRWLYAIRSSVTAALLAWFWSDYSELRGLGRGVAIFDWLLAFVVGTLIVVLWVALDFSPLSFGDSAGYDPRDAGGAIDWRLALSRTAGSVLVVPITEELFWRSFLMRRIQRAEFLMVPPSDLGMKAVIGAALFFGVEHPQWFAGTVAGFGYAWLYIRTGNLWTAVVAHAVSNAMLAWWVLQTGAWNFW
jgi:uncharacterized protein